jgi:hypothetical protein
VVGMVFLDGDVEKIDVHPNLVSEKNFIGWKSAVGDFGLDFELDFV